MKLNFNTILDPTIDPTNRDAVLGHFPDGTKVKVERRLDGWEVNLRIVVNDVVWHDSEVLPDEIKQVNILRESALNNQFKQQNAGLCEARERAEMWLLDGKARFVKTI